MRVLITGGTGYLGSHLALELARLGHQVTAVARAPSAGSSTAERLATLAAAGVKHHPADLTRRDGLDGLDPAGFEVIFHGVCSFLEPATGDSLTLTAAEAVTAFARRAPGLRQVVDLSSNLVLRPPPPEALPDEDAPCEPETVHGRNKLAAERMLADAGLPWVSLRIGQLFGGVGSSFDWVMVDPIRRGAFPVPCDGANRVALVHVDDACQAARLALEAGVQRRVFNVASGDDGLTLGQVFDEVAAGFGLPPPRRLPRAVALGYAWTSERVARLLGREPALVADMVHALSANRSLSIARARAELGYRPRFPDVRAGLRQAYAEVFAGRAAAFVPKGRLASVRGGSRA